MSDFDDYLDDWTDAWCDDEDEEPYLVGFTDWPELTRQLVQQDWLEIDCGDVRLFRQDRSLIVFERPPLNARTRRGLHRAGFRRTQGIVLLQWRWSIEPPVLPADPGQAFRVAVQDILGSRTAVAEKATLVAREVMRAAPGDVGIALATKRFREQQRRGFPLRS